MSQPLQGGVQQTDFIPDRTFSEVLTANPGLNDVEKKELSGLYLNKYVFSKPEWSQSFTPDEQNEYLTGFNKKYNVGQIEPSSDPLAEYVNKPLNTLNLGLGSVLGPAQKALTFGLTDPQADLLKYSQKQYPGIATDPGLMGDAFRLNQNPIPNTLGNILGAFSGTANVARAIPKALSPVVQRVAPIAGFSGASNLVDTLKGNQNPLQALSNTAIDSVGGALLGGNRVANSAIQGTVGGAGGYLSSLIADATNGKQLDFKRAQQEALRQGALGAGMGLAFGSAPKSQPTYKGLPVKQGVKPLEGRLTFTQGTPNQIESRKFASAVNRQIEGIKAQQAIESAKGFKAKLSGLESLYKKMAYPDTATPNQKQMFEAAKANIKQQHAQVSSEFKAAHPELFKEAPKPKSKDDIAKAVKSGVKARTHGKVASAQFNEYLNRQKFSKSEKTLIQAKITERVAEIKAQKAAQKKAANEKLLAEARKEKEDFNAQKEADKLKQKQVKERQDLLDKQKKEFEQAQRAIEAKRIQQAVEKLGPQDNPELKALKEAIIQKGKAQGLVEAAKIQQAVEKLGPQDNPELKALKEAIIQKGKAQGLVEAAKTKQAVESLTKSTPKDELNQLKEDILSRHKQEREKLADAQKKERSSFVEKVKIETSGQSQEGILRKFRQAYKKNVVIRLEGRFEGGKSGKGGESLDAEPLFKNDTPIGEPFLNKNNDVELPVINAQGKLRGRLLNEKMSGSRVISAQITNEKPRFKYDGQNVIDLETGKIVPQDSKPGVFSSEILQNIEQMEATIAAYKQGKAEVKQLMDSAKPLRDNKLQVRYEDMGQPMRAEIHEDITGDAC